MPRYEITGTATDKFPLRVIQSTLREAGAKNVRERYAFGWRNQPHVATFTAANDREAKRICERARELAGPFSLPAFLPFEYRS